MHQLRARLFASAALGCALMLAVVGCTPPSQAVGQASATETPSPSARGAQSSAPPSRTPSESGLNCDRLRLSAGEVAQIAGLSVTQYQYADPTCKYFPNPGGLTIPDVAEVVLTPRQGVPDGPELMEATYNQVKSMMNCALAANRESFTCYLTVPATQVSSAFKYQLDRNRHTWQTHTGGKHDVATLQAAAAALMTEVIRRAESIGE
ncbi:hypothetical protein [Sinomonas sp. ASV322]|uniref:hypothetical protein n=1 Tax=Sinomonas sp. ASV322 TaxID=3041920 RepID=UPI0027DB5C00|nr:hypothetical protein [Sinomonas sp. ASV322]MDQ4502516.1 hypothetical protein [Sinomonas sp. ASV322]